MAEMPEKEPENVPLPCATGPATKARWSCAASRPGGKGQGPVRRGRAGDLRPDDLPCHHELEPLRACSTPPAASAAVRCGWASCPNPAKADAPYPVLFARMREDLKAIDALAAETGVKAVLEIHMDTLISSPSAAYRALEGFDPAHIGLIFDPGNMVNEGFEDYQKSFELWGLHRPHPIKNGILAPDGGTSWAPANGSASGRR